MHAGLPQFHRTATAAQFAEKRFFLPISGSDRKKDEIMYGSVT